jgi:hypothetical protein
MCDHILIYRHAQQLQRRRPAWQCGTCGRVAYRPLDCCAQPTFASRADSLTRQRAHWWAPVVALWRTLDFPGLPQWRSQAMGIGRRRHAGDLRIDSPSPTVIVADEYAEAAEAENTPVAAGDRG